MSKAFCGIQVQTEGCEGQNQKTSLKDNTVKLQGGISKESITPLSSASHSHWFTLLSYSKWFTAQESFEIALWPSL